MTITPDRCVGHYQSRLVAEYSAVEAIAQFAESAADIRLAAVESRAPA